MAEKDQRFGLVMTPDERRALDELARTERISQAAVIRRLVWQAAHQQPAGTPAMKEVQR